MEIEHGSPTMKPGRAYAGVVIELPEPMNRELQDWRASFGDSAAGTVPAHITLMIADRGDHWDELAERVREAVSTHAPFHVEIAGTGTFRPVTPVVYLKITQGFHECVDLHSALEAAHLVSASPFPFHPHVTLAHAVTDAELERAQETLRTYRASFLVDHIALYEGDQNSMWHMREHIALTNRVSA